MEVDARELGGDRDLVQALEDTGRRKGRGPAARRRVCVRARVFSDTGFAIYSTGEACAGRWWLGGCGLHWALKAWGGSQCCLEATAQYTGLRMGNQAARAGAGYRLSVGKCEEPER